MYISNSEYGLFVTSLIPNLEYTYFFLGSVTTGMAGLLQVPKPPRDGGIYDYQLL